MNEDGAIADAGDDPPMVTATRVLETGNIAVAHRHRQRAEDGGAA